MAETGYTYTMDHTLTFLCTEWKTVPHILASSKEMQ